VSLCPGLRFLDHFLVDESEQNSRSTVSSTCDSETLLISVFSPRMSEKHRIANRSDSFVSLSGMRALLMILFDYCFRYL
jgi:hypothetical protein